MFAPIRFHHGVTDEGSDLAARARIVERFFQQCFLLDVKRIEQYAQGALLGIDFVSGDQRHRLVAFRRAAALPFVFFHSAPVLLPAQANARHAVAFQRRRRKVEDLAKIR